MPKNKLHVLERLLSTLPGTLKLPVKVLVRIMGPSKLSSNLIVTTYVSPRLVVVRRVVGVMGERRIRMVANARAR